MSDIEPRKRPLLTTYEALLFRDSVIKRWNPQSDVWAFNYGDDFLGCLATFGSVYITYIFRKELKLRPFARLTCYMPVVGISSLLAFMFQDILISTQIVKLNSCPLCVSTKAGIGQVVFGVAYPMVAAGIVCFHMADRLLTYPVPPLVKAPREVFQLFKKIVLKNPRPYLIIGAMHMMAASYITFEKQQCLMNLDLQTRR